MLKFSVVTLSRGHVVANQKKTTLQLYYNNKSTTRPVLAPLFLSRNAGREGPSVPVLRDRERGARTGLVHYLRYTTVESFSIPVKIRIQSKLCVVVYDDVFSTPLLVFVHHDVKSTQI